MFNLCVASSLGSMFLPGEGEAILFCFPPPAWLCLMILIDLMHLL
jgi:hypothetical protein